MPRSISSKLPFVQNDLNFGGSQFQTSEIAITFYYRIVDGHTEFPHCMLLFDKSNKRSTQLEIAVIKI
jgi:hypothetical protein